MIKLIQFSKENCLPCKVMKLHINNEVTKNSKINYDYIDIQNINNTDYGELLSVIISQGKYKSLPLFVIVEEIENEPTAGVIEILHTTKYKEIDEVLSKYFIEE